MFFQLLAVVFSFVSLLPSLAAAYPTSHSIFEERLSECTSSKKRAAIQHVIDTISSHSHNDAALIPLAADASRTFYVT